MKSQLLLFICRASAVAVLLIAAGVNVFAAPATTPPTSAGEPATLPRSEFENGAVKAPLRDPFFPKSTRYAVNQVAAPPTKPGSEENTPPPVIDCYADIVVRGLSISARRRIATINGQTFAPGDELPVKTPRGPVKIKVIEIKDRSVVVKAEGNCDAKELPLKF